MSESKHTPGRCPDKAANGGTCPHHNLQCAWPKCEPQARASESKHTPATPEGTENLARERDEVLRQLDDRTNQTWSGKRSRWAKLVRALDAELDRLRADLAAEVERLRAENAQWRSLYWRAVNCANGLTNYVEDRPELRRIERELETIETAARAAIAASQKGEE